MESVGSAPWSLTDFHFINSYCENCLLKITFFRKAMQTSCMEVQKFICNLAAGAPPPQGSYLAPIFTCYVASETTSPTDDLTLLVQGSPFLTPQGYFPLWG